jgi:membrane-associated protease RseP (regulator of RpoE activity)
MLKQIVIGIGTLGLLFVGGNRIAAQAIVPQVAPNTNVQSYSVITENRVDPDGKRVQKRQVWQNGVLVEEKEEVLEGDGEELSAEMDGQTLPGTISRSERNSDFFDFQGKLPNDVAGLLRNMEEDFNARRAEIFRRFGGGAGGATPFGLPGANPGIGGTPMAVSEYWIGASVAPVSDEVAYQLDLADGEGILVREIIPGSPAEKAGLAKYDILLQIGDEGVTSAAQIGQVVDAAKETPLTVRYIRKGEQKTTELTPEKRPEQQSALFAEDVTRAEPDSPVQREKIRVVRPGMIVPDDTQAETPNDDTQPAVPSDTQTEPSAAEATIKTE